MTFRKVIILLKLEHMIIQKVLSISQIAIQIEVKTVLFIVIKIIFGKTNQNK
jgi:hypothetical protein